jgi:hypothetical protein
VVGAGTSNLLVLLHRATTSSLARSGRPWSGTKERRDTMAIGKMEPSAWAWSRRGLTATTAMGDSGRRRGTRSGATLLRLPPPWCSSPSQIRAHDDDSLCRLFLSAFPSPAPATVTRRCGSGRRPATATRGRSSGRRDNAAAGGGRATRRHDSGRRLVRPLPLLPSLPLPCQVGAADVGTTVVPYHSHPLFSTILSLCLRI